jgi:dodecin
MSVVKVIELLAQSEKSWEDAVQVALTDASKTIRNINSIYVKDFQAIVDDNQVTSYRVNVKLSFLVER